MYLDEMKKRREYYNQLMEIRGNIRVFCRARPILDFEKAKGTLGENIITYPDEFQISLNVL